MQCTDEYRHLDQPAQAGPEQAAARMQRWALIYKRHPGIKLRCRQLDGAWVWEVTPPASPTVIYPGTDAMMAALLPVGSLSLAQPPAPNRQGPGA